MTEHEAVSLDAASQRAVEQARLRKERREAKIREGATARLNRITGLVGGLPRDDVPVPPPKPSANPPKAHADPEEVDISEHYYEPRQTFRPPTAEEPVSHDDLRRLMLGLDRSTPQLGAGAGGLPGQTPPPNDPFAALMSQMLPPGANPGASPFGGAASPFGPPPAPVKVSPIWRILHALFALSLGAYVALSTPFGGTLSEREATASSFSSSDTPAQNGLFWIFASAEAVLLTTRFFVDGGQYVPTGVVGTVLGFLPAKMAGYIRVVMRYGQIFATVRSDLLVCVFVLGLASLWRSGGVAA